MNPAFPQQLRYNEYKFLVQPEHVAHVTRLLDSLLAETDPFPCGQVVSAYYDTVDHRALTQCRDGSRRKIKFRVRRYNDEGAAQLQVKLKDHFAIRKLKAPTTLTPAPPLRWPGASLSTPHGRGIRALASAHPGLAPFIEVSYERHRYRYQHARMTLDAHITGRALVGMRGATTRQTQLRFGVLEIKVDRGGPLLPPALQPWVRPVSFSKFGILSRLLLGEPDVLPKYEVLGA